VTLNPRKHHGKWRDECITQTGSRSANEDDSVTGPGSWDGPLTSM